MRKIINFACNGGVGTRSQSSSLASHAPRLLHGQRVPTSDIRHDFHPVPTWIGVHSLPHRMLFTPHTSTASKRRNNARRPNHAQALFQPYKGGSTDDQSGLNLRGSRDTPASAIATAMLGATLRDHGKCESARTRPPWDSSGPDEPEGDAARTTAGFAYMTQSAIVRFVSKARRQMRVTEVRLHKAVAQLVQAAAAADERSCEATAALRTRTEDDDDDYDTFAGNNRGEDSHFDSAPHSRAFELVQALHHWRGTADEARSELRVLQHQLDDLRNECVRRGALLQAHETALAGRTRRHRYTLRQPVPSTAACDNTLYEMQRDAAAACALADAGRLACAHAMEEARAATARCEVVARGVEHRTRALVNTPAVGAAWDGWEADCDHGATSGAALLQHGPTAAAVRPSCPGPEAHGARSPPAMRPITRTAPDGTASGASVGKHDPSIMEGERRGGGAFAHASDALTVPAVSDGAEALLHELHEATGRTPFLPVACGAGAYGWGARLEEVVGRLCGVASVEQIPEMVRILRGRYPALEHTSEKSTEQKVVAEQSTEQKVAAEQSTEQRIAAAQSPEQRIAAEQTNKPRAIIEVVTADEATACLGRSAPPTALQPSCPGSCPGGGGGTAAVVAKSPQMHTAAGVDGPGATRSVNHGDGTPPLQSLSWGAQAGMHAAQPRRGLPGGGMGGDGSLFVKEGSPRGGSGTASPPLPSGTISPPHPSALSPQSSTPASATPTPLQVVQHGTHEPFFAVAPTAPLPSSESAPPGAVAPPIAANLQHEVTLKWRIHSLHGAPEDMQRVVRLLAELGVRVNSCPPTPSLEEAQEEAHEQAQEQAAPMERVAAVAPAAAHPGEAAFDVRPLHDGTDGHLSVARLLGARPAHYRLDGMSATRSPVVPLHAQSRTTAAASTSRFQRRSPVTPTTTACNRTASRRMSPTVIHNRQLYTSPGAMLHGARAE